VKPPILYVEGYDLVVFQTPETAEGWFELPDVNVGVVYDAEGRVLEREVADGSIRLAPTDATRPDALRAAILRTFDLTGIAASTSVSLDYLVAEARRNFTL
jgi:hypothetical protein